MSLSPVHVRRWRHLARIVEKSRRYNQTTVYHSCGTPACLMGHAMAYKARVEKRDFYDITWNETSLWLGLYADVDHDHLFGLSGCNNAGRSGKKAAAYVREWLKQNP